MSFRVLTNASQILNELCACCYRANSLQHDGSRIEIQSGIASTFFHLIWHWGTFRPTCSRANEKFLWPFCFSAFTNRCSRDLLTSFSFCSSFAPHGLLQTAKKKQKVRFKIEHKESKLVDLSHLSLQVFHLARSKFVIKCNEAIAINDNSTWSHSMKIPLDSFYL